MIDLKKYEVKLSITPSYLIYYKIKDVKYFQLLSFQDQRDGSKGSFIAITSKTSERKKSRKHIYENLEGINTCHNLSLDKEKINKIVDFAIKVGTFDFYDSLPESFIIERKQLIKAPLNKLLEL